VGLSFAARDAKATALALAGDESLLIARVCHSELVDGEAAVVSRFIVVDVLSGHYIGTVGQPCRGVAPAAAEFVDDVDDRILIVTRPVLSQNITGTTHCNSHKKNVSKRVGNVLSAYETFESVLILHML